MKINWSAIAQSVIVALLLGVGATAWQTYQAVAKIPALEAELATLRKAVDDGRAHADAADIRQSDDINDIKVTLAVLESRSNAEAAAHGKAYAPAVLEGR